MSTNWHTLCYCIYRNTRRHLCHTLKFSWKYLHRTYFTLRTITRRPPIFLVIIQEKVLVIYLGEYSNWLTDSMTQNSYWKDCICSVFQEIPYFYGTLCQGYTNFPKIYTPPPQNCRHRKGDTRQFPYWGHINIRYHAIKLVPRDLYTASLCWLQSGLST